MSITSVASSPALQWVQNYLSAAGASTGKQSSCGCQPSGDTTSISPEAAQLNASQTSQSADQSQTSGVSRSQGHHRHHHHQGGGQGGSSFVDQLAQSIVTDLQQATGSGATAGSGTSSTAAATSSTTSAAGGSFIDKLASSIANDLLTAYQQATGSSATSSSANTTSQVSSVA